MAKSARKRPRRRKVGRRQARLARTSDAQQGAPERLTRLYRESDWNRLKEPPVRPEVGVEPYRAPARRDYARVIHSSAFRRLQGKTQLFPGNESDFFRNRLTHSLEVAQIAKGIAYMANWKVPFFAKNNIDPDVVEVAALVHDIGHPPFGHNGEKALDDCMKKFGGFEGNAQTFRILTRLERKDAGPEVNPPLVIDNDGRDKRLGLNLCFRVLAAALKYDREIPSIRADDDKLEKGYYRCDSEIVAQVKKHVEPTAEKGEFRTIECSIMDIADDIAYSTYDLEDSFKAGFLNPLEILGSNVDLLSRVAEKVNKKPGFELSARDVLDTLRGIFLAVIKPHERFRSLDLRKREDLALIATHYNTVSRDLAEIGYSRTEFTAALVSKFLAGVRFSVNEGAPAMSKAYLAEDVLRQVEVLKNFTYEAMIMSPRLKVAEYRGYNIVKGIFKSLSDDRGSLLLPPDARRLFDAFKDTGDKMRVICDFIAGMTDRYALEFYGRLYSETPQSIFKPI